VDTRRSSLNDKFDNYFISKSKNLILHPTDNLLNYFDTISVIPNFLYGRVSSQKSTLKNGVSVDEITKEILMYWMADSYNEDLLVYESGGGDLGQETISLLYNLQLKQELKNEIISALYPLGRDYDAIHIRNTDMKTDYISFFKQVFPLISGRKLLVCSDDLTCRDVAEKFFKESDVITITDIPDTKGKSLHNFAGMNIYEKNKSMLTDLFGLSGAKNLFCPSITSGVRAGGKSGFALLAELFRSNPHILNELLFD
jgi:hypothetical protein